ncbi:unnamed protein product [Mytilus coruscus]|uniref:G-protein coupled receptors family 1 profile domain-containing protein n=1 Tax=Mytilus coruscus TaxID=42192 RepID=A0A6J8DA48_MYTCO|nr:unnamed protein product [Mytilus coruscus]
MTYDGLMIIIKVTTSLEKKNMAAVYMHIRQRAENVRRDRVYRERNNTLDYMDDEKIVCRYKLSRPLILELCRMFQNDPARPTARSRAFQVSFQIMVALRFYTIGSFQMVNADDHNISRPSVSKLTRDVTPCLKRICKNYITMPTDQAGLNSINKGNQKKFNMHVNVTEIYENSTTGYLNYYGTVNIERDIQKYSKPVICLSGFIGNFLSAAIFLSKSQRKTSCSLYLGEFNYILQYLYYIDTVVTLVLPTLITIFLMIPITYNLLELLRRQQARLTGKSQQKDRRQSNPQSKVTKLLFSVSLAFILLSLPSHVVRTHLAISSFVALEEIDPLVVSLKYIFETIYYLSFAVNIVIYLTFGDRFRSDFKNKFCSRFSSSKEKASQTTPSVLNADKEESNTLLGHTNNVTSETHV